MAQALDPAVAQYRARAEADGLATFRVSIAESDLSISCSRPLYEDAYATLGRRRAELEDYIRQHPAFLRSLAPVAPHPRAPAVVRAMAAAGSCAGVGPMAAVAGALADQVGTALLRKSPEVIVENGGDLFCRVARSRTVAVDAGASPLSYTIGIRVGPEMGPVGICTSSGTRGGSLSFGRADAACAVARSAALADAAATAIGNVVGDASDIEHALALARSIPGLLGALIVAGEQLGAWGKIELAEMRP